MHSSNTALHALYHLMACPITPRCTERGVHPLLKSEVPLPVKGNVEAVEPLTVHLTLQTPPPRLAASDTLLSG